MQLAGTQDYMMTQRVPSAGYYDNIVEDHSYTTFSLYPPATTVADHWQLTKEENVMVRRMLSIAKESRPGKLSDTLSRVR